MDISYLLIILLVGALATFLAGDKIAAKVALFLGLVSLGFTLYMLSLFNAGQNVDVTMAWITKPVVSFSLKADGLAFAMLLLNGILTPIIILSSFGNEVKSLMKPKEKIEDLKEKLAWRKIERKKGLLRRENKKMKKVLD